VSRTNNREINQIREEITTAKEEDRRATNFKNMKKELE